MGRFFRSVGHSSRVVVILLLAVSATLLAPPSAWAGGHAGYGCPPGFDVGGLTFAQNLNLPRIQAGLAAGAFDEEFLLSVFSSVDHNGDGVVCFKDVASLNGGVSIWQYFYNLVDNNASVPAG